MISICSFVEDSWSLGRFSKAQWWLCCFFCPAVVTRWNFHCFFNREVKIFLLRHRISIFCWEKEAPRSSEATKMIRLLRNSTIILFGSSAHSHSNVSEQKRRALRHRMIRALISFLNPCRSTWAGWCPQQQCGTWQLSLLCVHSSASSVQQLPQQHWGRHSEQLCCLQAQVLLIILWLGPFKEWYFF